MTFSQPISGFVSIWAAGGENFLLLWCSYRKNGQFLLGPRRKAQHKEQQKHTQKVHSDRLYKESRDGISFNVSISSSQNHTGQGNCLPAFTRALRRATLCMHVCTAMLRVTHLLAAHLGSSQTISAADQTCVRLRTVVSLRDQLQEFSIPCIFCVVMARRRCPTMWFTN